MKCSLEQNNLTQRSSLRQPFGSDLFSYTILSINKSRMIYFNYFVFVYLLISTSTTSSNNQKEESSLIKTYLSRHLLDECPTLDVCSKFEPNGGSVYGYMYYCDDDGNLIYKKCEDDYYATCEPYEIWTCVGAYCGPGGDWTECTETILSAADYDDDCCPITQEPTDEPTPNPTARPISGWTVAKPKGSYTV